MTRTILGASALLLFFAPATLAQPRLNDYHEGWPYYRDAVVDHVADQISGLSQPNLTAHRRAAYRDSAKLLLEQFQLAWEQSPRRAWRGVPSTRARAVVPGLDLGVPPRPLDFNDAAAMQSAIDIEERLTLAELDSPWLRPRKYQVEAGVRQQLQLFRDIYRRAWSINRRTAWSALDLNRIVRALETLARRKAYEASQPALEQVLVNRVIPGRLLPLHARPEGRSAVVGSADNGDVFDVLARSGRWVLVRASDGRQGWAHSYFLRTLPRTTTTSSNVGPIVTGPTIVTVPTFPAPQPRRSRNGFSIHLEFGN